MLNNYIKLNFSIIPLQARGKKPTVPWAKYQHQLPSDTELDQWFPNGHDNNIGIVTGQISGLVVIDLDTHEALDRLKGLCSLPRTPTVKTAKGWHFYFKHPGGKIGNRAGLIPGVDVRGDGGFVVAPPSVHPSGVVYEWEVSLEQAELADLPAELLSLLQANEAPIQKIIDDGDTQKREMTASEKDDLGRLISDVILAEVGTRNDTLNRSAFALGQMVGAGTLDDKDAQGRLLSAALFIGLPEAEALATIQSGLSSGIASPRIGAFQVLEILDELPEVMDRPIRLIDGKAYGATWLPVGVSGGEKDEASTQLVIFDEDRNLYCEKEVPGARPISDLPFNVDIAIRPKREKLLGAAALKEFIAGRQLDPAELFRDLTVWVDAFVSFENSLADQATMSEMAACYILGTYCLDAFDVVGYLWPTGEKGSGKTQFLQTVSRLAFLGRTITSGSTFATIRDEAHYGATIAFDDCENLKGMDPPKRELLLAGNTRGTEVALKTPGGADGEWETTYVNSFAPRLFSSIGLPDQVLSSRTIRVPLIRTDDTSKTRRSPMGRDDLPFEPGDLIDRLWLFAVSQLGEMKSCDQEASVVSTLSARDHDIWRMILSVAYWLQDRRGVDGVFDRMNALSVSYTDENQEDVGVDLHTLVLMSVNELLGERQSAEIAVMEIVEKLMEMAPRAPGGPEISENLSDHGAQRVGQSLGSLGFEKSRSHGSKRRWVISRAKIEEVRNAKGIALTELEALPF